MDKTIFNKEVFPIRNKLFRFALRIVGDLQEAEDVVQEVLEKIWKSTPEQCAAVQNWEAWCMTLTRNRALDKTRQINLRRADALDGIQNKAAAAVNPAQAAEQEDTVSQIRLLITQLPEKQRMVIHLRDFEEMNYEEIAQTLTISLDQVKVNLHRARKTVREKLQQLESLTLQT